MIDMLSKLEQFGHSWYPPVYLWNDIYIYQQLFYAKQDLMPLTFELIWIQGHADEKKRKKKIPLTRPEEMNIYADNEASTAILEQTTFNKTMTFIPLPTTHSICYKMANM